MSGGIAGCVAYIFCMLPIDRRFSALDAALLFCIAVGGAVFLWRVQTHLQYEWDWGVVPQFLFRYDPQQGWVPNVLMEGMFTTVRLSIWSTIFATIIGIVMGLCRVSRSLFWRLMGRTYVEGVRNLPPLVLVFIFYFFVSSQLTPLLGLDEAVRELPESVRTVISVLFAKPQYLSSFFSGVMTLSLYEGAYITEIVRAGVESVPRGQWEASASLGLNRLEQLRLVILPQASRIIIPPMAGQFISTIKDSAIVSVISIQELTFQGLELMASTYLTFEIWITITAMYLVLTLGCPALAGRMEKTQKWKI